MTFPLIGAHGPPSSRWALPATGEDESYTVSLCRYMHKASGQQARGRYHMTENSAPCLRFGRKNIFEQKKKKKNLIRLVFSVEMEKSSKIKQYFCQEST